MEQPDAKRRRTKPEKYGVAASNREEELFQQALANSRQEKQLARLPIDEAPTFRPSQAEFSNPLAYIESIRSKAEHFGICLIVPPDTWNAPCCVDWDSQKEFSTKRQSIDRLQESMPYADGNKYTPQAYRTMADAFLKKWIDTHPGENSLKKLHEDYWNLVDGSNEPVTVEYGNDIDTTDYWSGFPKDGEYGTSGWNLNNIAKLPASVLKYYHVNLPGVNSPWLYLGMLFSTFSWHNEDNYLASINYHHMGAPKQWYGVPGAHASSFENVVRRFYKQRLMEVPDLLHHMNTMFSPSKLKALDVPVYSLLQVPGTFVVTFPRAFHSGFSYGFNCGEAVNFAGANWIEHAKLASERYRRIGRLAVLGHDRLIFTLAHDVGELPYEAAKTLRDELDRLIKEEKVLRPRLYQLGCRDVSKIVHPPKNKTDQGIDAVATDYDDKRVCLVCRHTCYLSAVACNCSQTQVACLRHPSFLCKCPNVNKYVIEWESDEQLDQALAKVDAHLNSFPQHAATVAAAAKAPAPSSSD